MKQYHFTINGKPYDVRIDSIRDGKADVTVNGASVGKTSSNISMTWLFYAALKYLLYHIANYGHSLETDPERQ